MNYTKFVLRAEYVNIVNGIAYFTGLVTQISARLQLKKKFFSVLFIFFIYLFKFSSISQLYNNYNSYISSLYNNYNDYKATGLRTTGGKWRRAKI